MSQIHYVIPDELHPAHRREVKETPATYHILPYEYVVTLPVCMTVTELVIKLRARFSNKQGDSTLLFGNTPRLTV